VGQKVASGVTIGRISPGAMKRWISAMEARGVSSRHRSLRVPAAARSGKTFKNKKMASISPPRI
jgi:ribosomal protein L3